MRVSELVEAYLSLKVLRPATDVAYRAKTRRLIAFMGDLDVSQVTTERLLAWRSHLLGREERPVQPVTWNTCQRHLRAV